MPNDAPPTQKEQAQNLHRIKENKDKSRNTASPRALPTLQEQAQMQISMLCHPISASGGSRSAISVRVGIALKNAEGAKITKTRRLRTGCGAGVCDIRCGCMCGLWLEVYLGCAKRDGQDNWVASRGCSRWRCMHVTNCNCFGVSYRDGVLSKSLWLHCHDVYRIMVVIENGR